MDKSLQKILYTANPKTDAKRIGIRIFRIDILFEFVDILQMETYLSCTDGKSWLFYTISKLSVDIPFIIAHKGAKYWKRIKIIEWSMLPL